MLFIYFSATSTTLTLRQILTTFKCFAFYLLKIFSHKFSSNLHEHNFISQHCNTLFIFLIVFSFIFLHACLFVIVIFENSNKIWTRSYKYTSLFYSEIGFCVLPPVVSLLWGDGYGWSDDGEGDDDDVMVFSLTVESKKEVLCSPASRIQYCCCWCRLGRPFWVKIWRNLT